ncbi:putative oxalate decarboxylase [Pseudocercospora fuligena]|uniref:Putative oxalate decarboxylase n=1 Tax=Pseudocercospora fuligena TaxID=685502 RepID=A0A8H6VIF9_9PEZI|nr:putative oxalate decarboxylase [Pseudocercospora fuligena]
MRLSTFLTTAFALTAYAKPVTGPVQEEAVPKQSFNFKRGLGTESKHLRLETRQETEQTIGSTGPNPTVEGYAEGAFASGHPYGSTSGKGSIISGGTNNRVDIENPSNLGQDPTDNGLVPNLKWWFSDSKTRLLKGGWVREQVIQDLPSSKDIAGAQQHLKKGAARELHWHRVAEWGFVYAGRVAIGAVDEDGKNSWDVLEGLDDENEYLLVFDDGNFVATGTTFNVDDWIAHTPKDILAKNFGVNASLFDSVPSPNPYIAAGNVSSEGIDHPYGDLSANKSSSYVIHSGDVTPIQAPGGGGTIQIFDSRSFPISTTIAASVVTIKPGGLRELHWHPTAEELVFFAQGQARATVFAGNTNARTFDFAAGDTAVFPDNSGHCVINTSDEEDLIWIGIFKADRVADISLT